MELMEELSKEICEDDALLRCEVDAFEITNETKSYGPWMHTT